MKPEFGTGALKITPGHDPNDFEIGRKHGLEEISAIGEDGRMTAAAGERFAGLTALEAREAVVAALREEGRIARTEPYVHNVPFSHRSGERIEPLISLQWFMRMDELAARALEAVRDGRVQIKPEGQRRRYVEWLENIRPWCISRQLWWGHQIPVYYRGEETYAGLEPPEGDGWERDPDVLDTWFSSQLWPFATLGWPDDTPALRAFYPTDVLSTARDILFLWVARMVMMGLEFTGEIPFSRVNVHTVIQAPDGRRMSKSLGTGIDPLELIDGGARPPVFAEGGDFPAYGADAVRWGLLAISSSQDVRFNEERVAQGRQLANKLYNASRLVLLRLPEDADAARRPRRRPRPSRTRGSSRACRPPSARWRAAIDAFDFHVAALRVYDFVYGELCDWYLELIKPRLYEEDNAEVGEFALHVLGETLALAHPLIPFVTEEIWSHVPGRRRPADGAPLPGGRRRAERPRAPRRSCARAIAAVQELRGWRDSVGAAAGHGRSRRGSTATATRRRPSTWPGSRGWSGPPTAASRWRRSAIPGATVAIFASDAVDLEAEAAARAGAPQGARGRDRARRGQARQRGVRGQGAGGGRAGRARQARAAAGGARGAVTWSWQRAEEHLLSLELFGMRFGLERMRRLLTALGSPQERFAAIHVVGTNGKSSTVRMTAALLEAHGVRTGAYLSPHLRPFAERIRIGDEDLAADGVRRRGRARAPRGRRRSTARSAAASASRSSSC